MKDVTKNLQIGDLSYEIYSLNELMALSGKSCAHFPYSLKVLLENLLRNNNGVTVTDDDIHALLSWSRNNVPAKDVNFYPSRVVMQDFTGVPAVVDLAALRDAIKESGGDPQLINPQIPVDLVIDHSVMVDYFGSPDAFQKNVEKEFERNGERYRLLNGRRKSLKISEWFRRAQVSCIRSIWNISAKLSGRTTSMANVWLFRIRWWVPIAIRL